jgi:L-rhamnonate dehydratase
VKITNIQAMRLKMPKREAPKGRRPSWWESAEVANPMSRYPHVKRMRALWFPKWEQVWCKITLEDGTVGYGSTGHGRATAAVIEDHFAPQLIGQNALAYERLADMMFRMTQLYGATGLASYAASAVDIAGWDARGKLFNRPVYELLGGPQKEKIFCYATGNDVDWYQELGFKAFKLACPYGPADGLDGLRKNEEFVAKTREQIGDDCELMLDCWMAFDVEYTVRLAEALRPYKLKWIEEYLLPDDFDGHLTVRQRIPWQGLASCEHWYTAQPFQWALAHRAVDILQPDINWCGGVTVCQKIVHAADAAGQTPVILHGGGNQAVGQHFSHAMAGVQWLECFVGTAPGVPLDGAWNMPGQAVPVDGWLTPNDAPGFGLELKDEWFEPFFG